MYGYYPKKRKSKSKSAYSAGFKAGMRKANNQKKRRYGYR